MNKIIEYCLVIMHAPEDGIEECKLVNKMITEGWQPFGNAVYTMGAHASQPMVKYSEPDQYHVYCKTANEIFKEI